MFSFSSGSALLLFIAAYPTDASSALPQCEPHMSAEMCGLLQLEHQSVTMPDGNALCGSSPGTLGSCAADTLLYLGSDIDMQALKWLAPWETRAVFMDSLDEQHDTRHGTSTLAEQYEDFHRGDSRPSYREHSGPIRAMRNVHERNERLHSLLAARLVDEGFTDVMPIGNLSFSFVHVGIKRTLEFIVDQVDGLLEPEIQQSLGLCGRVSTFVLLAFGHELFPELLLSLTCMPRLRFVVKAQTREGFAAQASQLQGAPVSHDAIAELPYRAADAFSGASRVFAICANANHSFVRSMLGIMELETSPLLDVFDTFETQHRHHQPPDKINKLAVKLGNLHALLGSPEAIGENSKYANEPITKLVQEHQQCLGGGERSADKSCENHNVALGYKHRGAYSFHRTSTRRCYCLFTVGQAVHGATLPRQHGGSIHSCVAGTHP